MIMVCIQYTIITPSQQTTEHSHVLRPNSFQSILSTPRKFLTKARRRVSLNSRTVVLKTIVFSLKQPSTNDDKKSAACIPGRKKGTKPPPQESK